MNRQVDRTTILIIDNQPKSIDGLSALLRQLEYRVLVVESGEQALKLLNGTAIQQDLPHLILLEVELPGLDGFETCRQIKAMPSTAHIPILFLATYNDPVSKVRGFDVGGEDYITKPFFLEEVQARINLHLATYRLHEQIVRENISLKQQVNDHIVQLSIATKSRELALQEIERLRADRAKQLDLAINHRNNVATSAEKIYALSQRERDVLELIAASKDDNEIAEALAIGESSVRTYRSRIARKLSAKNSYEVMRIALEHFGKPV